MNRTVTARLMGDPPPGRSAQEQLAPGLSEGQDVGPVKSAGPARAAVPSIAPAEQEGPPGLACIMLEPIESLRPIEPIQLHDVGPLAAPPTAPPVFIDVDPRSLMVEPAYQRELTTKSLAAIRRIATGWDWRRFRPPVVVMTDEGGLILDGQHTAIAAASRPDLATIPVQLVEASEVAERALAFIGLNTGQLAHTAVGLHKAAVTGGDVTACAVDRICTAAGVTVRGAFGGAKWNPGDTAAVRGVRDMLASVGERKAVQILQALAAAGLAPISATDMRAAEMLFTNPDYAENLNPLEEGGIADLASAILALGSDATREAKVFAKAQCVPLWRALGIVWFRKARKRRKIA